MKTKADVCGAIRRFVRHPDDLLESLGSMGHEDLVIFTMQLLTMAKEERSTIERLLQDAHSDPSTSTSKNDQSLTIDSTAVPGNRFEVSQMSSTGGPRWEVVPQGTSSDAAGNSVESTSAPDRTPTLLGAKSKPHVRTPDESGNPMDSDLNDLIQRGDAWGEA